MPDSPVSSPVTREMLRGAAGRWSGAFGEHELSLQRRTDVDGWEASLLRDQRLAARALSLLASSPDAETLRYMAGMLRPLDGPAGPDFLGRCAAFLEGHE